MYIFLAYSSGCRQDDVTGPRTEARVHGDVADIAEVGSAILKLRNLYLAFFMSEVVLWFPNSDERSRPNELGSNLVIAKAQV